MAILTKDTWVVVADSEKALFLRNLTDHEDPHFEVVSHTLQDNPPAREQGTDRRGRRSDTGQGQRSAMEETDWHELAKNRFAKDLSDKLFAKAHNSAFAKLVVVASPQVLGVLRAEMHPEVTEKIVAEIPKNLTGHPVGQIETLVKKELDGT